MKTYKTAWFVRFARKEGISDASLRDAIDRAEQGVVDADLGGGVIKQRIARAGEGKSGGWRSIVLFRRHGKAFFVFGFAKNTQANIRTDELEQFKKMAKHVLALSDQQVADLVAKKQFEEVANHD